VFRVMEMKHVVFSLFSSYPVANFNIPRRKCMKRLEEEVVLRDAILLYADEYVSETRIPGFSSRETPRVVRVGLFIVNGHIKSRQVRSGSVWVVRGHLSVGSPAR
jgi:hypothetical protein